ARQARDRRRPFPYAGGGGEAPGRAGFTEKPFMTTTAAPPTAATALTATPDAAPPETLADLHRLLGSIPLERIRCQPPPGTATEDDVLLRPNGEKRLFELVDGVLVEKAMGYYESRLATVLGYLLERFLEGRDLGVVSGADATMRLR